MIGKTRINRWMAALLLTIVVGVLTAACGATETPDATRGATLVPGDNPHATTSPAGTPPTADPMPTPAPSREWELESVRIEGSTVIVPVRVFAGIDVKATLDGLPAGEVKGTPPVLEYVFTNVTEGRHTVEVRDVVGYEQALQVTVSGTVTGEAPTEGMAGLLFCVPADPISVAVGDTWTIGGRIRTEGGDPSQADLSGSEQSTTFRMLEIGDWVTLTEAGEEITEKNVRIVARSTEVMRGAGGDVMSTYEAENTTGAVSVANGGPVLTLDWGCHRDAWLQSSRGSGSMASVSERVLPSGLVAVVFSVVETAPVGQGFEQTTERHVGYDKRTGRLVLTDTRNIGTLDGKLFSFVLVQELVSDGTSVGDEGQGGTPAWLDGLVRRLSREPVTSPPSSVTEYQYKGQTVYFVPQQCCDIFSDLYDVDGNLIGHPDGGITGRGDGRVPDFFNERTGERLIWKDDRTDDLGTSAVPAPIESVEVLVLESFPPQYNLEVVSALRNGCVSFDGYRVSRNGTTFHVEIMNREPTDPKVMCAQVYSTVSTFIALGSDFEAGETYTVAVNDVTETFVAQ